MVREGAGMPIAQVWQFPKTRLHHWPQLPQTLINWKINHSTLQVQNEVQTISIATGLMAVRSLPKMIIHSALLSQYLCKWFLMMLQALTFYTWTVFFSPILHHISLLFLNKTKTVLVDGKSYCLFDLGLGV